MCGGVGGFTVSEKKGKRQVRGEEDTGDEEIKEEGRKQGRWMNLSEEGK